jgi:hypothetical protein
MVQVTSTNHRNIITSSPKTTPAIPAGTPKLVPTPLELDAVGLELVVVVESSAAVGETVPEEGLEEPVSVVE